MDLKEEALKLHGKHRGKLATQVTIPIKTVSDMILAYTPGVAEVSKVIAACSRY